MIALRQLIYIIFMIPIVSIVTDSAHAAQYLESESVIDSREFGNLSAAISSTKSIGKTILISNVQHINNLTIPEDRHISLIHGGKIIVSNGCTLRIRGHFNCERSQCFNLTARVVFETGSVAEIYPEWWGAVGNGIVDDSPAFQSAANSIIASGGGKLKLRATTYRINSGIAFEGPKEAQKAPSLRIGPIDIDGYGAKIRMDKSFELTVSPIHRIVCGFIGAAQVKQISIRGITVEGPTQIESLINTSSRYNVAEPAVSAGRGIRIQGFNDATIEDCVFIGLSLAVVIDDEDPRSGGTILAGKSMNSYRAIVRGCFFKNNWTSLSFTYGGLERAVIIGNHFESGVIKLINMTDNGNSLLLSNNTFKNIPSVIIGMSNVLISNNTFENCLGGVWIDYGSDYPSINYNYNKQNINISNNSFFSNSEFNSYKPISFLYIATTAHSVSNQVVNIKNLSINNNNIEIWNETSSASAVINFGSNTNATTNIYNFSLSNNNILLKNNSGAIIHSLPSEKTKFSFGGDTVISGNRFIRESGGTNNVEINIASHNNASDSRLIFQNNYYSGASSTNTIVKASRFNTVRVDSNDLNINQHATRTGGVFDLLGTPIIFLTNNNVKRHNSKQANGVLLRYGIVDSSDQMIMERTIVKSSGNIMNYGFAGIHAAMTYKQGSGLIESFNDIISQGSTQWISSSANLNANNVVNPTSSPLSVNGISHINALKVVPSGYTVRTLLTGKGDVSAYRLTETGWKPVAILP